MVLWAARVQIPHPAPLHPKIGRPTLSYFAHAIFLSGRSKVRFPTMKRNLKMKCANCGKWNRVPVNKIFIEQTSPGPKVQVLIPMYEVSP